jgi:MoxR-like ATPase
MSQNRPLDPYKHEDVERVKDSLRKLVKLKNRLKENFVDKDEIIDMMIICAIAQEPMVIFGEPGTAKSAMISRFCDYLGFEGQDYFKYLLTQFTEPDELLGVVDIAAYMGAPDKKPRFRRFGEEGIQRAKIVFLDEIFRANSAILNTLLSIINERIYYEGGAVRRANTRIVYGAANDAPIGNELRAFYSRFPIRLVSGRVSGTYPLDLMSKGWERENEEMIARAQPNSLDASVRVVEPICDPTDLEICQNWLLTLWAYDGPAWRDKGSQIQILKNVYVDAVQLLNCAPEQYRIDDRKFIKLFKLVLASALLCDHENEVNPGALPTSNDICLVLRHAWEDPGLCSLSQETVQNIVSRIKEKYAGENGRLNSVLTIEEYES